MMYSLSVERLRFIAVKLKSFNTLYRETLDTEDFNSPVELPQVDGFRIVGAFHQRNESIKRVSENQNVRIYWTLSPVGDEPFLLKHVLVQNFRLTDAENGFIRIRDIAGLQAEKAARAFYREYCKKITEACIKIEGKLHTNLKPNEVPSQAETTKTETTKPTVLGKRL